MKYTVLSVAYPLTPVGPDAVGGSEQILTMLDKGLTAAGHRSIVIAAEGSKVKGSLVPAPKANGHLDESVRASARRIHHQLIRETLTRHAVDVVHMHSLDFHQYLPDSSVPVLATLHLPPDWYPASIFKLRRPNFFLNCVSSSQMRACPNAQCMLPAIPNGVDVHAPAHREQERAYALALGRICPEKGFHFALDAARAAGCDMILAGEVFPYEAHKRYFQDEILSRTDRRRRFIGPVGLAKKRKLLAQARCLLVPSTVPETSSLVAMEAMALGTPVIAFGSGALPEIVEHQRTGFLVSNVKEMAEAIGKAGKLDRDACRSAARTRFSASEMIRRYLETYDRIIDKSTVVVMERVRPGASWLVAW